MRQPYRVTFTHPTFLASTGTRMPNTGRWQDRHIDALLRNTRPSERPIVELFRAWADYADQHLARFDSNIGDDTVLGPAWRDIGLGLRTLLNGETGRLDCGTLDAFLVETLTAEGWEL